MAFKAKTYLGEFCAHEDEENQSQELARRLHLSPPVCADQRSHMQIESLCVPPHSQSFPLGSLYALQAARFFISSVSVSVAT